MAVQVEFWQLITLLISFLGFLFAAGKLLLSQIELPRHSGPARRCFLDAVSKYI